MTERRAAAHARDMSGTRSCIVGVATPCRTTAIATATAVQRSSCATQHIHAGMLSVHRAAVVRAIERQTFLIKIEYHAHTNPGRQPVHSAPIHLNLSRSHWAAWPPAVFSAASAYINAAHVHTCTSARAHTIHAGSNSNIIK